MARKQISFLTNHVFNISRRIGLKPAGFKGESGLRYSIYIRYENFTKLDGEQKGLEEVRSYNPSRKYQGE